MLSEGPNVHISHYNGKVTTDSTTMNAGVKNFVLRSCSLRNTKWLIGMCVYTGHDTKVMLNSPKARSKKSTLEKNLQTQFLFIFKLQQVFCFCGAMYNAIWMEIHKPELNWYLGFNISRIRDFSFAYNFFARYGN